MPNYEYKCENEKCTQDTYTELLPMKDYKKETRCPKCKKVGVKQFGCNIDKLAASKWRM
jgi:putative FmdB family regulatory protein